MSDMTSSNLEYEVSAFRRFMFLPFEGLTEINPRLCRGHLILHADMGSMRADPVLPFSLGRVKSIVGQFYKAIHLFCVRRV